MTIAQRSSYAITTDKGMVIYLDGLPVHRVPVSEFPRLIELLARKLNEGCVTWQAEDH